MDEPWLGKLTTAMAREWLKSLRKEQNLSQEQLEEKAGITPHGRYSRIEKGYTDLTVEEAAALAAALKATPAFIQNGTHPLTTVSTVSIPVANSPVPAEQVKLTEPATNAAAATPQGFAPRGIAAASVATRITAGQAALIEAEYHGENISDPENFRLVPPSSLCNPEGRDPEAFRRQLSAFLREAAKVLHTPRIPAKVWARWREMEKKVQALLAEPRRFTDVLPTLIPKPLVQINADSARASSEPLGSTRNRTHKSFEAKFVDQARVFLTPATFTHLERAAVNAKTQDPSAGFMKHFFRLAREQLPPKDFQKIEASLESSSARVFQPV